MRPEETPAPDCDCCAGTDVETPRSVANPPGLAALAYRVGTYNEFLATMKARLGGRPLDCRPNPLARLTTRAADDPAVAMLDAWAMVVDILTFYQERIANEGYLATASEDRSVRELGRLVSYRPKPGVAAAVDLAFTLDAGARTTIPKGQAVRSVPDPGQSAQTFETVEDLDARADWNAIAPLKARVQTFVNSGYDKALSDRTLYLKGITANLKPNDPLLLLFDSRPKEVWRVAEAQTDPTAGYTTARIELWHRTGVDAPGPITRQALLRVFQDHADSNTNLALRHSGALPLEFELALGPFRPPETPSPTPTAGARPRSAGTSNGSSGAPTGALSFAEQKGLFQDSLSRLVELMNLIGPDECPPFTQLVVALQAALAPQAEDMGAAVRAAFNSYASTPLPTIPGDLADDLNSALAETHKGVAEAASLYLGLVLVFESQAEDLRSKVAAGSPAAALSDGIRRLRELQRVATEARFTRLAMRIQGVADAVVGYASGSPSASTLAAVKTALATAPIYANVITGLNTIRQAVQGQTQAGARGLAGAIAPVLPDLLRGVQVTDDSRGPLAQLILALNQALEQGVQATFEDVEALARRSDIELANRIVQRIRQAVDDYMVKVLGESLHPDGTEDGLVQYVEDLPQDPGAIQTLFHQLQGDAKTGHITGTVQDDLLKLDPNGDRALNAPVQGILKHAGSRLAGEAAMAGLRREAALFDSGSFPRIESWYKDLVAAMERFLELLPLEPTSAAEIACSVGRITAPTKEGEPLGNVVKFFKGYSEEVPSKVADAALSNLYRNLVQDLTRSTERSTQSAPTVRERFAPQNDAAAQLVQALNPNLEGQFFGALGRADIGRTEALPGVAVLRAVATPFGASAPLRTINMGTDANSAPVLVTREWPLASLMFRLHYLNPATGPITGVDVSVGPPGATQSRIIPLDPSAHTGSLTFADGTRVDVSSSGAPELKVVITRQELTKTIEINNESGKSDQALTVTFSSGSQVVGRFQLEVGKEGSIDLADGRFDLARRPQPGSDVVEIAGEYNPPLTPDQRRTLSLDSTYLGIAPGSYVAIDGAKGTAGGDRPIVARVERVETVSEAAYGISGKVTRLTLDTEWLGTEATSLRDIRGVSVLIQGDPLELADEPFDADVDGDTIQLDGVVDGLEAGRVLIVEGERTDLPGVSGVTVAERAVVRTSKQEINAMLEAEPTLPNRTTARPHTTVVLQDRLKYAYKRRAAKIYGNVARATHGLTQREVLGSGGGDPSPKFTLKQAPLTFLPANNPTGVADTLEVRVNDLLWQEVASPQDLTPGARAYTVRVDAQGFASVQFGDGRRGARPPAGRENIRAVYRTGLGSAGNLDARKLTQLATRPLGVKDVTNPLPSLGGFDPESPDQARRNVAAGITALQRLVSVPDYADFARGFAGIDKADAVASSAAGLHRVLVTVAGTDDTPLPATDLFKTLGDALQDFGDPTVPVELLPRRLSLIVLEARIRIDPAALWVDVERAVRARLLDLLGFDRRALGEDVWLGPILAAIQGVAGVTAVEILLHGTVPELDPSDKPMTPDEVSAAIVQIASKPTDGDTSIAGIPGKDGRIRVSPASSDATGSRGAEIAYLTDKVPATLVLTPKEAP